MKLHEITDKARADMVAAHQAEQIMTWRKFIQVIKKSTMSDADMDAVLDEIHTAFGHPRALESRVNKRQLQDLANITNVSYDELELLAGL